VINIDLDKEWNHFTETIKMKKLGSSTLPGNSWKMVAAILVLVVSGLVINYFIYKNDLLYEARATTRTVILPDSSTIVLNRFSSILHKPSYNEEKRLVELEGEAFFDVKPDRTKPFIIETNESIIEVTGTSFTISAYDSLKNVEVTVLTGTVSFSIPGGKQVDLGAGQKAIYVDGEASISVTSSADPNVFAWANGDLAFNNAPLTEVLKTLSRVYNVNFTGAETISPSCVVTVSFHNQSLESVLRVLESTLSVKFEKQGGEVKLTSAGC
jgi:transmembrane sensor